MRVLKDRAKLMQAWADDRLERTCKHHSDSRKARGPLKGPTTYPETSEKLLILTDPSLKRATTSSLRFGLGITLAILPVATALGFIALAIYGSFLVLVLLEAATRAVQRGIIQPARETLFAVVEREDKYKARAFIDTFVYRSGDVAGAQTEGVLGLAAGGLISVVFPLAMMWVVLALWLGRAHDGHGLGEQRGPEHRRAAHACKQ